MKYMAILAALALAAAPLAANGALPPPAAARIDLLPCGARNLPQAIAGRLARPLPWDAQSLRLDKAIHEVARRAGIPVSAVLSDPLPLVRIPHGDFTPAALLGRFAGANPGYSWSSPGGVVWFVHDPVHGQPENFLNWQVPEIEPQGRVGQFLPVLKDLASSPPVLTHTMVVAGAGAAAGPCVLPTRTLKGQTVRAILQRVMQEAPQFYSIIVFPRRGRLTRADALKAMAWWQWVWLGEPPPKPIPGISAISKPRHSR